MTEEDFKKMWGTNYPDISKMEVKMENEFTMARIKFILVWMGLLPVGMGFWAAVIIGVVTVVSR